MIGAIAHSRVLRLVLVGLLLLAVQTTLLVDVQPAGVILQVVLAFAAAAGVAGGPERGMLAGFVLGLMYDLGTGTPIGSTAITMGLAGVAAGSIALVNVDERWWLAAIFVALGAALGELAVPVVRSFIGQTDVFTDRLFLIVPVVALFAALVSPLFVPVSRWCLRLGRPEWKVPPE
jgi:rod shape-determining protein MreD